LLGAARLKSIVWTASPDTAAGKRWRLLVLVRLREQARKTQW
jgi:hypothetical protein